MKANYLNHTSHLPKAIFSDIGHDGVDSPGDEGRRERPPVVAQHDEGGVGGVVGHAEGVGHRGDGVLGGDSNQ